MLSQGMGSKPLVSIEEAAAILDTSVDNLRRTVRRQLLRPHYPNGRAWNSKEVFFHIEEINAFAEVRETKLSPEKVASFAARGYAAARALERRVEMLEQLIGARHSPLPCDEESVIALYQRGLDALGFTPTTTVDILEWAEIFIAMGEEFFEALEVFTDDGGAWNVFYQVTRDVVEKTPHDELYADWELEAAYRYFEAGRKHFLRVAYFHVRNRFGVRTANRVFEERPNDFHEEILTIINAAGD